MEGDRIQAVVVCYVANARSKTYVSSCHNLCSVWAVLLGDLAWWMGWEVKPRQPPKSIIHQGKHCKIYESCQKELKIQFQNNGVIFPSHPSTICEALSLIRTPKQWLLTSHKTYVLKRPKYLRIPWSHPQGWYLLCQYQNVKKSMFILQDRDLKQTY